MKTWRFGVVMGAFMATLVIVGASCGDDDDDAPAPPVQPVAPVEPDPLNLEIQAVTIPPGENVRPVIRFRVTDGTGAPVSLETEIANYNLGFPTSANRVAPHIIPRFTLAQLDDFGDYTSYYASTRAPAAYTYALPEGQTLPPTTTATVAATEPVTTTGFPLADLVAVGNGVYDLTLGATTVTGLDRTKTHTAAGWIVRTLPATVDADVAYDSFNFVPAGGGAVQLDEVVSDTACNRCHGTLQAHGTRRGVQLCITCHSPQTTDAETSRTVDFKEMIHKIHAGSSLPSVREGGDYFIVGNRQSVHSYSEVAFPWHDHGVAHCTVCHTGGEDADNWRARPNLAACTSCHDNVKFDGTAAANCGGTATNAWTNTADCNHSAGPIAPANRADSSACTACHGPGAAFRVDLYHHGD